MDSYTISNVLQDLESVDIFPNAAVQYQKSETGLCVGLAVESMKRHTTDEGWQIFRGLRDNGYRLYGYGLKRPETDVKQILSSESNIKTLVIQDKREWDVKQEDFRDPNAAFKNVEALKERNDIFKVTILKDSQHSREYHKESADEMGCHAWIIYYHPKIVKRLAPYVRSEHCIRTYHTLDPSLVPEFRITNRRRAIISGAVSGAYPLRKKIIESLSALTRLDYLKHPGYHVNGCVTPEFLQTLSEYKVSVCTSSRFGYLLRKIPESVACGCRVITDLPIDEVVPDIDKNLIRIHPNITLSELDEILCHAEITYDPEEQRYYSELAKRRFDFKFETKRLIDEIEKLRMNYP